MFKKIDTNVLFGENIKLFFKNFPNDKELDFVSFVNDEKQRVDKFISRWSIIAIIICWIIAIGCFLGAPFLKIPSLIYWGLLFVLLNGPIIGVFCTLDEKSYEISVRRVQKMCNSDFNIVHYKTILYRQEFINKINCFLDENKKLKNGTKVNVFIHNFKEYGKLADIELFFSVWEDGTLKEDVVYISNIIIKQNIKECFSFDIMKDTFVIPFCIK